MCFSAAKKKKDKDDGAPVIMTGTYMFSNGDKYGKINSRRAEVNFLI